MNEFKDFIDLHRALGIPFTVNHQLDKPTWQQRITDLGHCVTSLACLAVVVHGTTYVFLMETARLMFTVDQQGVVHQQPERIVTPADIRH